MTFYPLEKLHQLHDGYCRSFRAGGKALLLVQVDGKTHLLENRCPHMDAPLDRATFQANTLRCPVHGIEFDLDTGSAMGSLANCIGNLQRFSIAYEGNTLGVMF